MRTLVLAVVAAMATTAASAADIANNLKLDTDIVTTHLWDKETTAMTINPELIYDTGLAYNTKITLGTKLNLWDNTNKIMIDDELDHLPVFDFGISMTPLDDLELELSTAYDFETETRHDNKLTATFSL